MRLQALEAKLDHLQLLEPQMQANADMLRGISLTIPELHTPSAEEFAATVAWPGAQATTTGGGGASAAAEDEEEDLDEEGEDDAWALGESDSLFAGLVLLIVLIYFMLLDFSFF